MEGIEEVCFISLTCFVCLFIVVFVVLCGKQSWLSWLAFFLGWRRSEKSSFPDSNEPEEKKSYEWWRAQFVAATTWPVRHRLSWGKCTGNQDAHIFCNSVLLFNFTFYLRYSSCNATDIYFAPCIIILTNWSSILSVQNVMHSSLFWACSPELRWSED